MTTDEERDAYKKSLVKHALKYLRPIVKATLPECSVRADTKSYQPKFILSQEGFEEFHVILRFEGDRWQKANLAGVKIAAPGYGEEQRRYGWKYGPELPRDITTGRLPNEKKFREGLRQLYDWHIAKQQRVTEAKEGAATAMAIMRDALKRPESCPYDGTLAVEEGADELTVLLVSDEGPRMAVRLSASPDGTVSLAYNRQYGRRFGLFHLSDLTDPAVIAAAVHDLVLMHEELVERCLRIERFTKAEYTVNFSKDAESGWWVAEIDDNSVKAVTQGDSLDQARERIRDALAAALDDNKTARLAKLVEHVHE